MLNNLDGLLKYILNMQNSDVGHKAQVRNTDPVILYFLFVNVLFYNVCVRALVGSIMLCRQSKRTNRQWANWRSGSKQSRRLEPPLRNSSQTKRRERS